MGRRKKGVSKKIIGGLIGRAGARKRAKEQGLTGKELRKAGRKGFLSGTGVGRAMGAIQGFRANKGKGFKERLKGLAAGAAGGFNNNANAGLADKIQEGYADRLQEFKDRKNQPEESAETAPEMTGAVGGGVDTSAVGAGMDTGALQRGGLPDRRRKRRVPPGDMPNPDARYESTKDKPRYKIGKKGLRTRRRVKRKEGKMQNGGMFELPKSEQDRIDVEVIKGTRTKKEQREADRSERQTGRKVERFKRVGARRKKSDRQGAGEVGLDRYREKLQNKAKRKRRRQKRRDKVRDFAGKVKAASQARRTARRNRRKERSNSGSGCQGGGCGAYE